MHEVEYLGKVLSDISPLKMLIRWQVYQIITSSKVIRMSNKLIKENQIIINKNICTCYL